MRKFKLKRNFITLIILLITYYIIINYVYINSIHPHYEYTGFILDINPFKIIEGICLLLFVIIPILYLIYKNNHYFFIIYLFCLFQVIPSITLFTLANFIRTPVYCTIGFLITCLLIKPLNFKISKIHFNEKKSLFTLTTIAIILSIPFIINFGLSINWKLFILQEIYDQRNILATKSNAYMGYIKSWINSILLPIILIIGKRHKKIHYVLFSCLFILYFFTIGGTKGTLFSLLAIAFFLIVKKNYIKQLIWFTSCLVIIIIISELIAKLFDIYLAHSLFTRRTILLPSLIKQYYFDFFQNHKQLLSHGFLNFLGPSNLIEKPQKLIGGLYFNNFNQYTNTGFISDAYMNFGILGTIFYSFILSLIIKFLSNLNIAPQFSGLFLLLSLGLNNSALTTTLLTHGLLLLIIVCFFLLKNTNNKIISIK